MKFGLIPELVGRLPVLVSMDRLDTDGLIRILREPKNSLVKQYQKLFAMDNISLQFEVSALRKIAELATEQNTGARGLRSILEGILRPKMFELPGSDETKLLITADLVCDPEKKALPTPSVSEKKVG